jgi:hypothetical protein
VHVRIQFNGDQPVDIPGVDEVQPGQTVEVSDAVGESLLTAGCSFADDGTPVEAVAGSALWTLPAKKSAPAATPTPVVPADAGKES